MSDEIDALFPAMSDEERKRLIIGNLLMGVSGGLLGARRGQELQGLGFGMLGGAGAAQNSLAQAQTANLERLKARSYGMDYLTKKSAYEEDKRAGDLERNFQMPTASLPDMSPTPANAAALAAQPKPGMYEQLMAKAEYFAANNAPKKAQQYREEALKYRPKFSTTPQVGMGPDGPYQYVLDESGNEKRLSAGATPKFREINTGGKIQVVNEYGLPNSGQSFDVTMNPFQAGSLAVDQGRLGLSQAQFRYQKDKDAQGPQDEWTNDLERGIQISKLTGQSRPIMAGAAPVGAKGESKKAEAAASAQTIVDLAKPLIPKSTGSYTGNAWDHVMQGLGVSTEGADAAAQLQVLQARLMTEQPRMEGPQSDRDVELYRKAAGEIGDPNIPKGRKMAALKMIEALNDRYRKKQSTGATGGWSITPAN